ncbi:MAG: AAC(3) family N-acetyltransferase, partial [Chloroflexota bacterium]|nr:AAC(3) family N-acetyltransferase [Chloroflexota bacterium]
MPEESVFGSGVPPIGRSRLVGDLRALGVRLGGVLMVHARVSALGWVVGGTGAVVLALLDALGPAGPGTLPGILLSFVDLFGSDQRREKLEVEHHQPARPAPLA